MSQKLEYDMIPWIGYLLMWSMNCLVAIGDGYSSTLGKIEIKSIHITGAENNGIKCEIKVQAQASNDS